MRLQLQVTKPVICISGLRVGGARSMPTDTPGLSPVSMDCSTDNDAALYAPVFIMLVLSL